MYVQLVQYPEKSTTCPNPALILNTSRLPLVEWPDISSLSFVTNDKPKGACLMKSEEGANKRENILGGGSLGGKILALPGFEEIAD